MQKRVLEVLKTWYFPYSAFWLAGQWEGYSPPPRPSWLRYCRHLTNKVSSSIFLEPVVERQLLNTISLLPKKKSVGHDNIFVIFIKLVA